MTNGWKHDKRWADRFMAEIKSILAVLLISEAPPEEDMQHNTDLMVLTFDRVRVACRMRRHSYLLEYPNQFTIRSERCRSGNLTEFAKIVEGWGDYLFYGFSDEAEEHVVAWHVIKLRLFRRWVFEYLVNNRGQLPGKEIPNDDGGSCFRAFKLVDLPIGAVKARQEHALVHANSRTAATQWWAV